MSESGEWLEIEREFGLSHYDFHRIFPRIAPNAERLSDRKFRISSEAERCVEVEISDEKVRRLATLRIPYTFITFRFRGFNHSQRAEFFGKFDLAFQKGGG